MPKAIAIAVTTENPLAAASMSAKNFLSLVLDFMYGTPQRVKVTYAFALGLIVLGYAINNAGAAFQVCPA